MNDDREHLESLLGAYALDAVDNDERAAVQALLRVDATARAEVDAHREAVAGALAARFIEVPPGLWDRIVGSLAVAAPEPTGDLARVLPISRRRWARRVATWSVVAAAAAIAIIVGVAALRDPKSNASLAAAMSTARGTSGSHLAHLVSSDGGVTVEAVVDPHGHGFVAGTDLPALADDRTYQLWGVVGGQVISLGVLGHQPDVATFSVDSAASVTELLISNEVRGGVPRNANTTGLLAGKVT